MNEFNLKKCYFIAEIGVNHNGNISLAKQMIKAAKESGADAVKFQTFSAEKLVSKDTPKVKYQYLNTNKEESHFEMIKKLELSKQDHFILKKYCDQLKINFFSTPYDIESAKFLNNDIKVSLFKTASADIVDEPLHQYIASTKKLCIVSVGMASLGEIEKIYKLYEKDKLILLHCVSNYPCTDKSLNLKVIKSLRSSFRIPVGLSDHSKGNIASISAVTLGAKVIEKHFTLDKSIEGPDQQTSTSPTEFKDLVQSIKRLENMLGNHTKEIQEEEKEMARISRKSIHIARAIMKNEKILKNDIILKRPGDGLYYSQAKYIIGRKASRDLPKDHKINFGDIN